ncbi:thermonuclease family protein [Chloroflexota bacterium]
MKRIIYFLYAIIGLCVVCLLAIGIIFLVNQNTGKPATVTAVIDGDTIAIDTGESVRLIGIDSPERGDIYFDAARDKLRNLVDGKTVRLERDKENKDHYGRLLRYVWVSNLFVNAEMVKAGYAQTYPYPPNLKYIHLFDKCEDEAQQHKLGMWYKETEKVETPLYQPRLDFPKKPEQSYEDIFGTK